MSRHRITALFSVIVLLTLATWAAARQTRRVDERALRNAGKSGEEWLTVGMNYAEQRYSPLKQIDTQTTPSSHWSGHMSLGQEAGSSLRRGRSRNRSATG